MNIKDKTVPELLDILNALLNRVLNDRDRSHIAKLAEQRTFSRAEKVLIAEFCRRYGITQDFVDANLIKA